MWLSNGGHFSFRYDAIVYRRGYSQLHGRAEAAPPLGRTKLACLHIGSVCGQGVGHCNRKMETPSVDLRGGDQIVSWRMQVTPKAVTNQPNIMTDESDIER